MSVKINIFGDIKERAKRRLLIHMSFTIFLKQAYQAVMVTLHLVCTYNASGRLFLIIQEKGLDFPNSLLILTNHTIVHGRCETWSDSSAWKRMLGSSVQTAL